MKKMVMVCVLGMAFAFLMSGCSSCPSWCPFAPAKDKATCGCCEKGTACTCAKDGKDACACCKDGAACKCEGCKSAAKDAAGCCKDAAAK